MIKKINAFQKDESKFKSQVRDTSAIYVGYLSGAEQKTPLKVFIYESNITTWTKWTEVNYFNTMFSSMYLITDVFIETKTITKISRIGMKHEVKT